MSVETKTALVLGATGGMGSATAEALARHGWKVRALSLLGGRVWATEFSDPIA
jgi:NAD(P)-dependent dehydrogenase (short-subunit alcohol dehydrogenase family)